MQKTCPFGEKSIVHPLKVNFHYFVTKIGGNIRFKGCMFIFGAYFKLFIWSSYIWRNLAPISPNVQKNQPEWQVLILISLLFQHASLFPFTDQFHHNLPLQTLLYFLSSTLLTNFISSSLVFRLFAFPRKKFNSLRSYCSV